MKTKSNEIPRKSHAYRAAEGVFYKKFNDVTFYIEDEDQENFYLYIFKKFFPDIRIEKIIPLGGKKNVYQHLALKKSVNQINIYIVDLDFDGLLGFMQEIPGLFYLEKYSIENYLAEEHALKEFIIAYNPTINRSYLQNNFDLSEIFSSFISTYKKIYCLFAIIQKYGIGVRNTGAPLSRFYSKNNCFKLVSDQVQSLEREIRTKLQEIDSSINLNLEIKAFSSHFSKSVDRYAGKHLIEVFLKHATSKFKISGIPELRTINILLAKDCSLDSLEPVILKIRKYIEKNK